MEAAQTFEKESGTAPGVDLAAITDRMEIRKAVQSGNVEEAIERVNDLNPEVAPPRWPAHALAASPMRAMQWVASVSVDFMACF